MTRVLLVPGFRAPSHGHWQSLWAGEHPEYQWASPPGSPFDATAHVDDLRKAVSASSEPAVLVAHGGGCLTVARWAWQHAGPVRGALLVAPPYLQQARRSRAEPGGREGGGREGGAHPGPVPDVPRDRLPFPAFLVASRTDPHATFAQSEELADAWDARLIDAGDAGHIDTASGHGRWPAGEALLAELL